MVLSLVLRRADGIDRTDLVYSVWRISSDSHVNICDGLLWTDEFQAPIPDQGRGLFLWDIPLPSCDHSAFCLFSGTTLGMVYRNNMRPFIRACCCLLLAFHRKTRSAVAKASCPSRAAFSRPKESSAEAGESAAQAGGGRAVKSNKNKA